MNTLLGILYSPPISIALAILISLFVFITVFVAQFGLYLGLGIYSVLSITNIISFFTELAISFFKTIFKDTTDIIEKNIHDSFIFHGDSSKPGLYIWHPHGLFACAPWIHGVVGTGTNSQKMNMATLPMYFRIPFLHDMFKMTGMINTNYDNLRMYLNDNQSVGIVVGGVEEMFQVQPYTLNLVLNKRVGYLRLAIETKKPIIPIITYGENELFETIPGLTDSPLNKCIKKYMGIIIPFTTLNSFKKWFTISEAPLPTVNTYVGEPVYPEETDTIETLREKYKSAIQSLFDKTRPEGYTLNFI